MESTVNNERAAVRRIVHLTAAMNGRKPTTDVKDELLFDPSILKMIDWSDRKSTYKEGRSPTNPGNNLIIRPLALHDFDRGYLQLLSQLTSTGTVTRESFAERFRQMKSCPNTYYIAVVEDTSRRQVIGTTTMVVEQKFIHSTGTRGRIEDVVVSEACRGLELGKLLVETMTLLGKAVGCYKVSLECADKNVRFYEGLGFNVDERYMVRRFGH